MIKKIILTCVLIIALVSGGFMVKNYNEKKEFYSEKVDYSTVEAKIKSGNSVYVYFFQPNCKSCEKISPYIMSVKKSSDKEILLLDVSDKRNNWLIFSLQQTPTVIHFQDKKELKRIEGEHNQKGFDDFFEN